MLKIVERVTRNVDAYYFLFTAQLLEVTPRFTFRHSRFRDIYFTLTTKQTHLGGVLTLLVFSTKANGFFEKGNAVSFSVEVLSTVYISERIKTSCQSDTFKGFLVDALIIYAFCQIENRGIRTFLALFYNRIDCCFSYSFHSPHSEAYITVFIYGKFVQRFIHIRR